MIVLSEIITEGTNLRNVTAFWVRNRPSTVCVVNEWAR